MISPKAPSANESKRGILNQGISSFYTAQYPHTDYNLSFLFRFLREFDIIPLLVKLLGDEDEDCHRNAAGALRNLSYGKFVNDNKVSASMTHLFSGK